MKQYFSLALVLFWLTTQLAAQTSSYVEFGTNPANISDAFVHSRLSTTNFGTHVSLQVASSTNGGVFQVLRSLVKFEDFPGVIPPWAIIDSARLEYYVDMPGWWSSPTLANSYLQRVKDPWNESTVIWNNQPGAITTDQISIPGVAPYFKDWQQVDVTDHVQHFLDNPADHYGWRFQLVTEQVYRMLYMRSSDYNGGANAPKLNVWYHTPTAKALSWSYLDNMELNEAGLLTRTNTTQHGTAVSRNSLAPGLTGWINVTNITNDYSGVLGFASNRSGDPNTIWFGVRIEEGELYSVEEGEVPEYLGDYADGDQLTIFKSANAYELYKNNQLIRSTINGFDLTNPVYTYVKEEQGNFSANVTVSFDQFLLEINPTVQDGFNYQIEAAFNNGTSFSSTDVNGKSLVIIPADIDPEEVALRFYDASEATHEPFQLHFELNEGITPTTFTLEEKPANEVLSKFNIGTDLSGLLVWDSDLDVLRLWLPELPDYAKKWSMCTTANNMNRTITWAYDENEALVDRAGSYYDDFGNLLQSQYHSNVTNQVFATETKYDAQGRAAIQTLVAPINSPELCYKQNFVQNVSGTLYDIADYDNPNYTANSSVLTAGEVLQPKPVRHSPTKDGTLGYYYSNNNLEEAYVPTSDYPYSRTVYNDRNLGEAMGSTQPGNDYQAGNNHENWQWTLPSAGELVYLYGYGRSYRVEAYNLAQFGLNQMYADLDVEEEIPFRWRITKTITRNADGVELVQFTDTDGNLLASARSGSVNGLNQKILPIRQTMRHASGYVDIHLAEGCEGSLRLANNSGYYDIIDLQTNRLVYDNFQPTSTAQPVLNPGVYRIKDSYFGHSTAAVNISNAPIRYNVNYYDFTVNYYDKANRLVMSVPPLGYDQNFIPQIDVEASTTSKQFSKVSCPAQNPCSWSGSGVDPTDEAILCADNKWSLASTSTCSAQDNELSISLPLAPNDDHQFTTLELRAFVPLQQIDPGDISVGTALLDGNDDQLGEYITSLGEQDKPVLAKGFMRMQANLPTEEVIQVPNWDLAGVALPPGGGSGGQGSCECYGNQVLIGINESASQYCRNQISGAAPWGRKVLVANGDPAAIGQADCMAVKCIECGDPYDQPYKIRYIVTYDVFASDPGATHPDLLLSQGLQIRFTKHNNDVWEVEYSDGSGNTNSWAHSPSVTYNQPAYIGIIDKPNSELYTAGKVLVTDVQELFPFEDGNGVGLINQTKDFSELAGIKLRLYRKTHFVNPKPEHRMITAYDYDAHDRMLGVTTPDEGLTEYRYTRDGRIRYSQSAAQREREAFSYTNYDALGRPIESGEYQTADPANYGATIPLSNGGSTTLGATNNVKFQNYYNTYTTTNYADMATTVENAYDPNNDLSDGLLSDLGTDITYTLYDVPDAGLTAILTAAGLTPANYTQTFVNGNVSKSWNNHTATWYAYDYQGRITWIAQDIQGLGLKTTHYTYDARGNVHEVIYQKDLVSEYWAHRYTYDADNRLAEVHTKTSAAGDWLAQSALTYYENGALKRATKGEQHHLQANDYTYTIQGRLKQVNDPVLDLGDPTLEANNWDPGKDGHMGSSYAPDLFAYALDYHVNDYERTGTEVQAYISASNSSYSGLITMMRYNGATLATGPTKTTNQHWFREYLYDNRQWLRHSNFGTYRPAYGAYGSPSRTNTQNYKTTYGYDANGNLATLSRHGYASVSTTTPMDDFIYSYGVNAGHREDNQLLGVQDQVTGDDYTEDLSNHTYTTNYIYNASGQLVKDLQDNVYYTYDPAGKVTAVHRLDAQYQQGTPLLRFDYDDRGFRVAKYNHETGVTSYYVRDASGQLLAVYSDNGTTTTLTEHPVYGHERLGMYYRIPKQYYYQHHDHLGNVRTVFHPELKTTFTTSFEEQDLTDDRFWTTTGLTKTGTPRTGLQLATVSGTNGPTLSIPVAQNDQVNVSIYVHNSNTNGRIEFNLKNASGTVVSTQTQTLFMPAGTWAQGSTGYTVTSSQPDLTLEITPVGHTSGPVSYDDMTVTYTQASGSTAGIYEPKLTSYQDFYPYGMIMPGLKLQGAEKYRFAYQGQEKDEETGKEAFQLRMWDARIARWLTTDPKREFVSPYLGMGNNPVMLIDPDGGSTNPIYDKDSGEFLGTDNKGLQGEAIFMDKNDFSQGMDHKLALSKGTLFSDMPMIYSHDFLDKVSSHMASLSSRPDWDGALTLSEANQWYREGNGQALYVDASKINLSPVSTSYFNKGVGQSKYYNFFTDLEGSITTGRVYGTIRMTLLDNHGKVKLGSDNGLLDIYDFDVDWSDGRTGRNIGTVIGGTVAGNGTKYNIYNYGFGKLKSNR